MTSPASCTFVPPFLLERLAESQESADMSGSEVADLVRRVRFTLAIDSELRARRQTPGRAAVAAASGSAWVVHTAAGGSMLPGTLVRSAGQPDSGDAAVDEAAANAAATLDFWTTVLSRSSFDDQGAQVVITVHYQQDYDNAFWDGQQLVFGDGDRKVFGRFTESVDVLAHEFGHAVTQFTAGLDYQGQPGALNESMSDVFGILVKQHLLGQTAAEADWLIGEGIFLPSVHGVALRSMKAPGTAYDDPRLGKDPQVGSMAAYVDTTDDSGGVHINSGIPNRAFHLTATALGGNAWDRAGPIWYAALTGGQVTSSTDFAGFAAATVAAAEAAYGVGSDPADAVTQAWTQVGLPPGQSGLPPGQSGGRTSSAARPAGQVVEVRRSGGFAGLTTSGHVGPDDDRQGELAALLSRIDFATVRAHASAPQPDRFAYAFVVNGEQTTVHEQDLTDDLRRLADLVLGERGQESPSGPARADA